MKEINICSLRYNNRSRYKSGLFFRLKNECKLIDSMGVYPHYEKFFHAAFGSTLRNLLEPVRKRRTSACPVTPGLISTLIADENNLIFKENSVDFGCIPPGREEYRPLSQRGHW